MRMNWGWKITIVYSLFVIAMVSAVIFSTTLDVNLVEENYYDKEVAFQKEIDQKQNAINDSVVFKVNVLNDSIELNIPVKEAQGKIYFVRAADINNDKKFELKLVNGKQKFAKELFKPGSYEIQVEWKNNNKEYYWEEKITI